MHVKAWPQDWTSGESQVVWLGVLSLNSPEFESQLTFLYMCGTLGHFFFLISQSLNFLIY